MGMTSEERSKCEDIIHGHAIAIAAANAAPIPGLGVAADMAGCVTMAMALASVFGGSLTSSTAEAMVIPALKQSVGKKFAKELVKFIPGLGSIAAPAITIGMIEAAGWTIANQLANQRG